MQLVCNMKFAVNLVAESSARLGSLSEFARIPEAVFETPLLLLHTRVCWLSLFYCEIKRWCIFNMIPYDYNMFLTIGCFCSTSELWSLTNGFKWTPKHASDASGHACWSHKKCESIWKGNSWVCRFKGCGTLFDYFILKVKKYTTYSIILFFRNI